MHTAAYMRVRAGVERQPGKGSKERRGSGRRQGDDCGAGAMGSRIWAPPHTKTCDETIPSSEMRFVLAARSGMKQVYAKDAKAKNWRRNKDLRKKEDGRLRGKDQRKRNRKREKHSQNTPLRYAGSTPACTIRPRISSLPLPDFHHPSPLCQWPPRIVSLSQLKVLAASMHLKELESKTEAERERQMAWRGLKPSHTSECARLHATCVRKHVVPGVGVAG
ncbi:hypothetical protein B0H10DRAFT_1962162 [Mycena sp. CBHHK59/15]|nr:hypothetical protein B0H10DRAFT_1962162 [Mycena sp. CBHHK59/15]